MGFQGCHFGQFGTINSRYFSRYLRVSGGLIRRRNLSNWVEGSLFAIFDLLLNLSLCTLNDVWEDDFHKKFSYLKKYIILLYYIKFFMLLLLHRYEQSCSLLVLVY